MTGLETPAARAFSVRSLGHRCITLMFAEALHRNSHKEETAVKLHILKAKKTVIYDESLSLL